MAEQDIGNLDSIRQSIQSWLSTRLPAADALVLNNLQFPEANGESSVTLILDAQLDGAERKFVFRMAPPQAGVFASHDIQLQYRLMEIMAAAGVPVPSLVGYEADASLVGSDFYVMHFVDGQIPNDNPPYAFGSWVTELDDDQRATMWRNGLEVLATIHSLDIGQIQLPTLPRAGPGQSPIQHELDKFESMLGDGLVQQSSPALVEALAYLKDQAPSRCSLALCWGDARVGNIIWRQLAPVAVLDWEMANIGDPLQDVSWWFWIDYINSVGLGAARLKGLPDRATLYQQWHQLTGMPIDNTEYYDLLSVVRYAIIIERKLEIMKAAGMGVFENFAVAFIPELLENCHRQPPA
jgi:aminoglycoside phosphotransferase (APT) family kinase protein